jgi:hypothetical protein
MRCHRFGDARVLSNAGGKPAGGGVNRRRDAAKKLSAGDRESGMR